MPSQANAATATTVTRMHSQYDRWGTAGTSDARIPR